MRWTILLLFVAFVSPTYAQNYKTEVDIPYSVLSEDSYKNERTKLDIYYPTDKKGFATVIFLHGGGLEGGSKHIPLELQQQQIAVVAPNYRLSPKAHHPTYIEDAAQSVAWTIENIARYGGDPKKIYLAGHSAGGYLTLMLALDKSYLDRHGVDADSLAGYLPISGQTNTHYTIRKERGMDPVVPIIDQYAPIYHSRQLAPPLLLVTGDRRTELTARYTENLHLQDILRAKGAEVPFYELQGFDHSTVITPALTLLLEMVKENQKE